MENTQKIQKITIHKNAHTMCRLGDDWYTTSVTMEMCPNKEIPDYRDVGTFFEEHIDGQHMTIEDVLEAAAEYIMSKYVPHRLITTGHVEDSNHPTVDVVREDIA